MAGRYALTEEQLKTIREIPLEQWSDVDGSKLRLSESVRSLVSLACVYSRLRRMRQS